MKRILFLSLFAILIGFVAASAGNKKDFRYEIVPVGVGTQGTYLIKVYSYARKEKDAIELAKRNAVHGVLFKGIVGGNGVSSQPALVKPKEKEKHEDFFETFFDKGIYLRYVSLSSDGTVDPKDRMKVGKEYKIGVIVSVNKADLCKYLESEGIVKAFGSMF